MSDYVHKKVVRMKFPKEILDRCDTDEVWDCEQHLEELLGDLWDNKDKNSFEFGSSKEADYIDWVYYYTYGDESGDWGHVRLLTDKELSVITPYFNRLNVIYENEDLRLVDYCYYNCCDCEDYYDLVTENTDDSLLFIN